MNKRDKDKFYAQVLKAVNTYRELVNLAPLQEIPTGMPKSCDSTAPMVKAFGRWVEPFSNSARLYWITMSEEEKDKAQQLMQLWNTNVQQVTFDKKPQYRVFLPEVCQQFLSEWFQGKHRRFWSK